MNPVLVVIVTVIDALILFHPTDRAIPFVEKYNILQGSSYCVIAATSMTATLIISAHIYSSTRLNVGAQRRYRHIAEIMIQSAVLYSLSMIAQAVSIFIKNANINMLSSSILNANTYTSVMAVITTVCYFWSLSFDPDGFAKYDRLRHLRPLSWLPV